MPNIQVKTKEANSIWKKGDREIFEVVIETDGNLAKVKSYSKAIAQAGFEGEVEAYEKEGRNGSETFVRQIPKEDGGFQSGGFQQRSGGSKPSYGGKSQGDNYTMYLSYSKDLAVALINQGDFKLESLDKLLDEVAKGGDKLFNHRTGSAQLQRDAAEVFDKDELNGVFDADKKDEYNADSVPTFKV